MPFNSSSSSSSSTTNKSKNNRGRFLQLASSSLRRSQKSSKTQTAAGGGGTHVVSSAGRGGTSSKSSPLLSSSNNNNIRSSGDFRRLSPLKEISTSRLSSSTTSSSLSTKNNDNNNIGHTYSHQNQQQQQQQQQQKSSMPVGANNKFSESGFSQSELYDLEESFKLFDINGEGSVQVGDLRSILNVLQQEQSANANTSYYYPHLKTLLYRLSELSDEENLTMDDYVQLMSSTTITNNNDDGEEEEDNNSNSHFARVFRLFDIEGKGYITVDDLERVAIELGEHDMTMEEIHEMIDRAKDKNNGVDTITTNKNDHDGNDNGRVYVDDFTRMMTTSLFSHATGTVNGGVEGEL